MSDQEILIELQKINQQLAKSNTKKTVFNSFLAGFFHSFGSFIGTAALFLLALALASQLNWTQALSQQFEKFMSEINWEKIVPQPKVQFDSKSIFQ